MSVVCRPFINSSEKTTIWHFPQILSNFTDFARMINVLAALKFIDLSFIPQTKDVISVSPRTGMSENGIEFIYTAKNPLLCPNFTELYVIE